jgi:hypothetical protein
MVPTIIMKETFHNVTMMGTGQHHYEILCKEWFCCGLNNRQPIVQECQIMLDGMLLLVHETIATTSTLFGCCCSFLFDEQENHFICVGSLLQ